MSNDPLSEVVASEPPVSQPVAVAEPPAPPPAPVEPEGARVDEAKSSPAVEQEATAEASRPRVQLNPTITPEQARPIPTPSSFATSVFVAVAAPTPLTDESIPAVAASSEA